MDIKPVSLSKRNLGGIDFFLLWAGVAISLAEIWAGGYLAPMGFWLGFLAIIIGHVIGNTLMGLGGIMGSDHGIMSMVSVRPSFGIRGSGLAAILNIIQLVGWASIMLIIGGRAGAMLGQSTGGILAYSQFWIVIIGLGTLIWALFTGKTIWKVLQVVSVICLMLIIMAMTFVSFAEYGLGIFKPRSGDMPFMLGLDFVIVMPISWIPLVADYSRFSKNTKSAFWNTWWGYFIVSSWMYILGLVATLVTGETEPGILILKMMGTLGLALPALAMVVFSTITSDFPDIYSATCSMLNISQKISAKTFMWIVGIFSILVAMVFPADKYETFLLFIGSMFIPLFGVVLTDYFLLRKRKINTAALFDPNGEYWYYKGFNITAILCWAIGFVLYQFITTMGYSMGGSLPSMFVSAALYYIFTSEKQVASR
ncbi:putative hydroxymethylpyrimidine transporter CytX [Desulfobacterales bacterium HSG16]|nr:putative hydroxymethylpyrimidine transporter CytX [Desulfobacterales bacterium HSG16]